MCSRDYSAKYWAKRNLRHDDIQWNLCNKDILGPDKVSWLSKCPDFPAKFTKGYFGMQQSVPIIFKCPD